MFADAAAVGACAVNSKSKKRISKIRQFFGMIRSNLHDSVAQ